MQREDCTSCDGTGVSGHDCGEDSCCCAVPEPNVSCFRCQGTRYRTICATCGAEEGWA
jgi:hypothetical protein